MGGGRVVEIHSKGEWDQVMSENAGKAVSGGGADGRALIWPHTNEVNRQTQPSPSVWSMDIQSPGYHGLTPNDQHPYACCWCLGC